MTPPPSVRVAAGPGGLLLALALGDWPAGLRLALGDLLPGLRLVLPRATRPRAMR